MSKKRRTRKQKEHAHYESLIIKNPDSGFPSTGSVKGQLENDKSLKISKKTKAKNAEVMAKEESLASTKREIIKSLILASFIIALEIVIYLAWNVKR